MGQDDAMRVARWLAYVCASTQQLEEKRLWYERVRSAMESLKETEARTGGTNGVQHRKESRMCVCVWLLHGKNGE